MIRINRSPNIPESLESEKKKNGSYKCEDVINQLKIDFNNKCYICEQKEPKSINVEHFKSHQGNIDLKFEWSNLFWSCSHCNNTKLDKYDEIIDCTDSNSKPDEWLKYNFNPMPFEKVEIETIVNTATNKKTAELLNKVYNGHTPIKELEAHNLRNDLIKTIREFQELIIDYYSGTLIPEALENIHLKIRSHINPVSNFTAFKRWIIRNNSRLLADFGEYLI